MKGISNVNNLYSDRVIVYFSEPKQKYNLESIDNFWKFLHIRNSITKGQFIQDKNPEMEFLELPRTAHRV